MKQNLLKPVFRLLMVFMLGVTMAFGQGENINLLSGNYNLDPYPGYNPNGSVTGTYTIRASKSAHTFSAGMFRIVVGFPAGAVYAGGAVLPAGFTVISGDDGSSSLEIQITGDWAGSGPTSTRLFVLPIRIVGPATDQPTATILQWDDPFITENPVANSTGSPLNVNNVLPVKLVSFNAVREGDVAQLSWLTSEEVDSDHFEVERSGNGKSWSQLGVVKSGPMKYTFTDSKPLSGENLYRLKMVDLDGAYAYSSIRSLKMDGLQGVGVYPNPAVDHITLDGIEAREVSKLEIISLSGKTVYKANSLSEKGISVAGIVPGAYVIKVTGQQGTVNTQKLVINR